MVLCMATVSTSETSVNFYQTTRRNIPADSLGREEAVLFTYCSTDDSILLRYFTFPIQRMRSTALKQDLYTVRAYLLSIIQAIHFLFSSNDNYKVCNDMLK
jgi:hypothetical protein